MVPLSHRMTQPPEVWDRDFCDLCGRHISEVHKEECPRGFKNITHKATDKVESDGGSSAYYKLPPEATDLQDLIEAKEMSFARGNLFKALYRMGEKAGTEIDYDLKKLQWFLDRMKQMRARGQRL